MRLYLSSYRFGDRADALVKLLPPGARIAISANALDNEPDTVRRKVVSMERAAFGSLGFVADQLDLRTWFGRAGIADVLARYDMLWTTGGNSFVLNTAMSLSRCARVLTAMLARNSIAYGGYSAGAVVAGISLRGVDQVDAIDEFPDNYPSKEPLWDGMGLVPYAIAPHFESDHPESQRINAMIEVLQQTKTPYEALRDGEVIVVDSSFA